MTRKIKPQPGQCWTETKTGILVCIVEGNQNGLVRYDWIESAVGGVPTFAGYWAEELKDWHKRFVRA